MPAGDTGVRQRIFLVDDHPLVREWLSELLEQQPELEVCGEAAGGPEALKAIQDSCPDLAVVDLTLKEGSGLELIKDLQSLCPGVAVLVLSMHEEAHYAERALRAGARGYVVKRDTARKVIHAIQEVLAGGTFVSESVATALAARLATGRKRITGQPAEILSDRELEVFELLGQGRGTRQISDSLCVSLKTVQAYCARIKEKLGLGSATELLREAVRWQEQQTGV